MLQFIALSSTLDMGSRWESVHESDRQDAMDFYRQHGHGVRKQLGPDCQVMLAQLCTANQC